MPASRAASHDARPASSPLPVLLLLGDHPLLCPGPFLPMGLPCCNSGRLRLRPVRELCPRPHGVRVPACARTQYLLRDSPTRPAGVHADWQTENTVLGLSGSLGLLLALPLAGHVTLSQLLHFSEPQFPHLRKERDRLDSLQCLFCL